MISDEKMMAVLGSPISHSLSPKLHNLAYSRLGVKANYQSFEVNSGDLSRFLDAHTPELWSGFSLTMPLKEEAFQLITKLDSDAKGASAINTLISDGENWAGINTDVFGFRYIFESFDVFDNEFDSVSILGAGGTARAALVALDGFSGEINVFRRSKARDLSLGLANPRASIRDWEDVSEAFNSRIIINALPIEGINSISNLIRRVGVVIDALYHPWPTLLSESQNGRYISGKDLLVAQALRQIELFSGRDIARGEFFAFLRSSI